MTDESVQNQVSTPVDGANVAPAVAVQATEVVLGGGNSGGGGASTVATGLHDAWLTAWKAETAVLNAVRDVPAHIENEVKFVAAKVEGDVVAELKALVTALHVKYDMVVARVALLEAHIEGRFGRI